MKLLVIDDEPDFAGLVVDVASGLGQQTMVSHDASDLSILERFRPDCVTLDLNMPGTDGIETIRNLADRAYSGTLILISGFNERVLQAAATLALAHGLRVSGQIKKPAQLDELERVLSDAALQTVQPMARTRETFTHDDFVTALGNSEFVPYFQPKLNLRSGEVAGAEALIRWMHPDRGILSPGAFLPSVTDPDLMDRITMDILEKALIAQKSWARLGYDVPVAVNFEATSFVWLDLPERISEVVERVGVPFASLIVEVTETSVVRDLIASLDVLSRVCIRGIKLSIDDFGTGHSTFDQLRTIPFSQIKIDRNFVMDIETNTDAQAIAHSMIELATRLNMGCVAEGIETRAQYEMLRTFGCQEGQGFFLARPMPQHDIKNWLGSFSEIGVA